MPSSEASLSHARVLKLYEVILESFYDRSQTSVGNTGDIVRKDESAETH
jgi:hypothetical protein